MTVRYGLWDTESGNSLGFYASQAALAVVRQELQSHGAGAVEALALDRASGAGGELIAEGAALVELARAWPENNHRAMKHGAAR